MTVWLGCSGVLARNLEDLLQVAQPRGSCASDLVWALHLSGVGRAGSAKMASGLRASRFMSSSVLAVRVRGRERPS